MRFTLALAAALASVAALSAQSAKAPMAPDWRPKFHATAPTGWLSDPNGLFFSNGLWHLHYQYLWPRQWGHATSRDLIRWEGQPVSLTPDAIGDCWSGCAVMDASNSSGLFSTAGGPVLVYTAHTGREGQRIALALSEDSGRTWKRYSNNPILRGRTADFRDPSVFWDEALHHWVMVLSEATHLTIFTSTNLRDWSKASEFDASRQVEDAALECPDLFELPVEGTGVRKWVLTYSNVSQRIWGAKPEFGICAQRYYVGSFDGRSFKPESGPFPLDNGPDCYASIAWPREKSGARRTVMIGWMNHWGYAGKLPTSPWQGCLTLPRELTLSYSQDGSWLLHEHPVSELNGALAKARKDHKGLVLSAGQSAPLGQSLSGEVRMTLRPSADARVELSLFGSASRVTQVGYDVMRGILYLDRRNSGGAFIDGDFTRLYEVGLPLPSRGELELDVVFDHSTVEVFADGGAVTMSAVVLPDAGADSLGIRGIAGSVVFAKLDVFRYAQ